MMVGAVHLSLADVYYPGMLAGGGGAVGIAAAAVHSRPGSHSKVREWAALHAGGSGGIDGAGGTGGPPFRPGGSPPGSFVGPAAEASSIGATNDTRAETAPVTGAPNEFSKPFQIERLLAPRAEERSDLTMLIFACV